LETPLIPFFPSQIAVFPSGGFFLAGQDYRVNKPTAAVYDAGGHLLKQLDSEETDKEPHVVSGSGYKAAAASESPSRSLRYASSLAALRSGRPGQRRDRRRRNVFQHKSSDTATGLATDAIYFSTSNWSDTVEAGSS